MSRIWGRGLVSAAVLGVLTVAAWAGIPPLSFAPTVNVELGPSGCTTGVDCSEGAVAVVAGDFNDDGKLDIATANNGSDDATVLLGNGQGGLTVEATLPAGVAPSAIASGNLDDNTVIDLVVANETDSTISVYLGNGDGTFDRADDLRDGPLAGERRARRLRRRHQARRRHRRPVRRVGVASGSATATARSATSITTAVSGGPLGMAAGRLNNDANEDLAVTQNDDAHGRGAARQRRRDVRRSASRCRVEESPQRRRDRPSRRRRVRRYRRRDRVLRHRRRCSSARATARSTTRWAISSADSRRTSWPATSTATASPTWPPPTASAPLEFEGSASVLVGKGDGTFEDAQSVRGPTSGRGASSPPT